MEWLDIRAAAAHAAAEAEGLALVPAENATGFKHVYSSSSARNPFEAKLNHGGRHKHLGTFATAEQAALAVARFLGPQGVVASLAAAATAALEPAPMTAAEAHAAAEAEGLPLVPAENATGFMGVYHSEKGSKKFFARLTHGGREHLGTFATAEEAALAVARSLGPEGVAAALAADAAKALEPAPMTAAEAHAAAEQEGLALLRADNATGFMGVCRRSDSISKPFRAQLKHDGSFKYLGKFATAEEAALAVARFLGPEAVAAALAPPEPKPAPMTAAEAYAAAAAEGLLLLRAENATGFKGVFRSNNATKPFQAKLKHDGSQDHLGYFATAEEAALAVARFLGPAGAVAALAADAAKALEPASMTAAEAHAAAAEEGLTLLRAENNATGFKGVSRTDKNSKPYQAKLKHGGREKYLGNFATAEEAALAVARFLGPVGAAAPPGRKRPAASGAGPSAPPSKRGKQPAADDDEYVVEAEAVSDDGPPTPPTPAPVLCYCERPAALLDGRWVCAQLVEGDFCILGREDE